ncbi:hypothetical protein GTV32_16355 [Gordonia sp. SID5947]|uniref:hypothetical protein n=1 Tax=Gordonia sp. SID5947 TaxID=2690315 RepID=UPI00137229EB|nr:hypothetical protein [Gordonia sp. SID5947]MYR07775.1 hypothetical protein [Gordonia sp. SID5947]
MSKIYPRLENTPKELKFLNEIPGIDVAIAGVGAGFQAHDDHDKGWSWKKAVINDGTAAAAGVIGGAVAVAAAPETMAAGSVVLVATATGMGVGDLAYQTVHEHWGGDIHEHGVVAGVGHGIKCVGVNTGHQIASDTAGLAKDVSASAKKLWHGLF